MFFKYELFVKMPEEDLKHNDYGLANKIDHLIIIICFTFSFTCMLCYVYIILSLVIFLIFYSSIFVPIGALCFMNVFILDLL